MKTRQSINRKNFLQTAVSGTAAFAFLRPGSQPLFGPKPEEISDHKIVSRVLGKTGLELPVVSMGVMNADNPNLVRAALDGGIKLLDTAHGYQRGNNEKMIGGVIKDRPRDSFFLATKVPDSKQGTAQATEETFIEKFHISLERLGLDHVDILYLHSISSRADTLHEPFLNALTKLKKDGKARFLGVSTHKNEPEVIQAVVDSKIYDVILTAYNFKQDHVEEMQTALANANKAGLGIVAMKTMAGGFLDRLRSKPVNTQAALKWVLQHPYVHTTIPGCTTFDQLASNIAVMDDLAMSPTEQKDLNLQGSIEGLYCQGCDVCQDQCPQGLPIPELMRSYMYTYGYRNLGAAQDLLISLDLPRNPCGDCQACSVACAKGFDIADRIADVARLRDVPASFIA